MTGSFPPRAFLALSRRLHFDRCISDENYLKLMFRAQLGEALNLDEPVTFNAKLQWLKLHDRNPLYTTLVDKYRVKPWVANIIGADHITKNYGVWENVEDIELDNLPERFVLKTNHDSGGVAICRNRSTFDFDAAKKTLQKSLDTNYYWSCREWPYKDVKALVFAEEYLETDSASQELTDYKVMCFDGTAQCVFTCTDRAKNDLRVDFFDLDWNHLPFTRHYPNADSAPEEPSALHEMISMAERLATGIPFVRCDFYEVEGRVYFGEMTFYPGSGFEEFEPECWDQKLGNLIVLPEIAGSGVAPHG